MIKINKSYTFVVLDDEGEGTANILEIMADCYTHAWDIAWKWTAQQGLSEDTTITQVDNGVTKLHSLESWT